MTGGRDGLRAPKPADRRANAPEDAPKACEPASVADAAPAPGKAEEDPGKVREIGGPKGPEPTRYGDWEKGGRCSDF